MTVSIWAYCGLVAVLLSIDNDSMFSCALQKRTLSMLYGRAFVNCWQSVCWMEAGLHYVCRESRLNTDSLFCFAFRHALWL
jgi:hypothetical protein